MNAPIDQEARDHIRLDHPAGVFVEAGAGTGKTTAIVDRIVAMVAGGWIELPSLAAITFTEAAASELRDRIRAALERAADGDDERITGDDERARCRRALEQLDEAALTTLHGFAQRILAEHPLEAGLPPGFEVMDDIRARVEFEQRWAQHIDALFAEAELEPVLLRFLALRLSPEGLHDVARNLHENHDRLLAPDISIPPLPPLRAEGILVALDRLLAHRRDDCKDETDKLATHIDTLVGFRHRLATVSDELDVIEALIDAPKCNRGKIGKIGCWDDVEAVRAAAAATDVEIATVLRSQRQATLRVLIGRVVEFVRHAAEERRRAGTLEFHDLLVFARNLLRSDAGVRRALGARYQCMLLDEFQDTDPLQIELAALLASDAPDAATARWQDIELRSGALVVVGDPKQSIYRFRRADLGVYHDAQQCLGLEQRRLVENFRSVPEVVDFVNAVFSGLLTDAPGVQAGHVELHAHRGSLPGGPAVSVFGRGVPDTSVGDVRVHEAADVAALVNRIKAQGWTVEDPLTGEVRKARFHDIALLIPSRTVLPGLEDALERADIPVRVESQSLVFSTAEVRDLVAVLAAIDDPTDEIAVVSALRSPGFGCSDADLAQHATRGGSWDYRRDMPDGLAEDHPVVLGLRALHGYWKQRWWRSVSETVEAIISERRLLELALERRRPRDHWRRIRYLLDQARAWDDAGDARLRSFVEWVQQQADERARVIESVAPEPDHDALRILTVHGAKGLEFPIVVLAGLNTQKAHQPRPVVWGTAGPEFGVGTKNANTWTETDGYRAAVEIEEAHDDAERLRLLYVAMTRARDHLVVSLHHKVPSDCHAAMVVGQLDGAAFEQLDFDAAHPTDQLTLPDATSAPTTATDRDEWIAAHERALAHAGRPASVAATALAKAAAGAADPGLEKEQPVADDLPPWRRGRAGTAIGRAVHAVLQTIDLATGAGLDDTARAQALAEEVPNREAEINELAESMLAAPIVRAAVADSARYWREVPVAAQVDDVLVEGFIDLLVEIDGGFVIVDYKTDRAPSDTELDDALARYAPQGAAYALALEAALGQPVARCIFVFARPGGAVEREIPDLPAAVTAVRGLLASQVASRPNGAADDLG